MRRRRRDPGEVATPHQCRPTSVEIRHDTDKVKVHGSPDAAGELAAWAAAVAHLHARGLPAAVPEFPAAWLARRGVRADWVSAA